MIVALRVASGNERVWAGRDGGFEVMLKAATVLSSIIALIAWAAGASAADVAAGAAKAEEICSECHDPADWEGEDAASLEAMIRDVVSGSVKHKKKLDLTDAEIENIAAYWASGG